MMKKDTLSEENRERRIKAFENLTSTTHWPAECEKKFNMREKRKNIKLIEKSKILNSFPNLDIE